MGFPPRDPRPLILLLTLQIHLISYLSWNVNKDTVTAAHTKNVGTLPPENFKNLTLYYRNASIYKCILIYLLPHS